MEEKSLPDPNLPEIESTYPIHHSHKRALLSLLISAVSLSILIILAAIFLPKNTIAPTTNNSSEDLGLSQFKSDEEFKDYISHASQSFGYGLTNFAMQERAVSLDAAAPNAISNPTAGLGQAQAVPTRVSDTNVQVAGIDEPDIVKTDGQNIFFSSQFYNFYLDRPATEPVMLKEESSSSSGSSEAVSILPPDRGTYQGPTTKIIGAFPPSALAEVGKIEANGNLLLSGNNLLVFTYNKVTGYDVTDKADPKKTWDLTLENNVQIVSSRLKDGKVYLVAQNYINSYSPCPMPLIQGGLSIACTDVWRPNANVSADSTYTVMQVNPASGEVEKNISFVGSNGQTVVYQSPNAIYITYTTQTDSLNFIVNFFQSDGSGILPADIVTRLVNTNNLDISDQAKLTEFSVVLQNYIASLNADDQKKLENDMQNKMTDYLKKHARDIETSGIAKIDTNSFSVSATGEFPGSPLNQFSLDEYKGNLRIATTINPRTMFGSGDSANDVYVLDSSLNAMGSVKDLGLGERVYSARFIDNLAYIVTFKQTDPFYVINLTNPSSPKVEGELKIPGFSSYLHPLADNIILGVGQENFQPKISLFDVSDPNNPTEVSKYNMSEGWTEVQNNHHAFLQDAKHKVFFMPAGSSGYIFSYENNEIKLVKAVADIQAKRALFINDYLYILGDTKIVVLNENDWQTVNELVF